MPQTMSVSSSFTAGDIAASVATAARQIEATVHTEMLSRLRGVSHTSKRPSRNDTFQMKDSNSNVIDEFAKLRMLRAAEPHQSWQKKDWQAA